MCTIFMGIIYWYLLSTELKIEVKTSHEEELQAQNTARDKYTP